MTDVVKTLDQAGIEHAKQQATAIAGASEPAITGREFVFFAAFDGTHNSADPKEAGDTQTTAIHQLYRQVKQLEAGDSSFDAQYYPGVGTKGTLPGSDGEPNAVTAQAVITANKAYKEFAAQAAAWHEQHPNDKITSMVTGFSRGSAAAAIFTQKLYDEGLVLDTPDGKQTLIPPGSPDAVSAALILDPVVTGDRGNMNFPPGVKNLTLVRAQDEHRALFEAADYNNPNARVLPAAGNHCDIGDAYDQGLGAIYLQAYTDYFRKAGLPIADPGQESRFDAGKGVNVHREQGGLTAPWNLLTDDAAKPRLTVSAGEPPTIEGDASRFTTYNNHVVMEGPDNPAGISRQPIDILPGGQARVSGSGDIIHVLDGASLDFTSTAAVRTRSHHVRTISGEVYQSGSATTIIAEPGANVEATGGNVSIRGAVEPPAQPESLADKVAGSKLLLGNAGYTFDFLQFNDGASLNPAADSTGTPQIRTR